MLSPGSTIGVLGSGQLGRMFVIEARRLGYRVHVFSPERDTPAGRLADREIAADYTDLDAVRRFAADVSVVTFEFENVPRRHRRRRGGAGARLPGGAGTAHHAAPAERESVPDRSRLPRRLACGRAIARGPEVRRENAGTAGGLENSRLGLRRQGSDHAEAGRRPRLGVDEAGHRPKRCSKHSSISIARFRSSPPAAGMGAFSNWGVIANDHHDHILDVSVAPAPLPPEVAARAGDLARGILEALGVVGILCVELFLTRNGGLIVNELAPRPHNSGHLTIDASITSQFEQHVRAVVGMPLGSTELLRPAAMANLLGDVWYRDGRRIEPDWAAALTAFPDVKLHLYGKNDPRPRRKMGHLTATAKTPAEARQKVLAARALLTKP